MTIDTEKWEIFRVDEIFNIRNGKGITKQEISEHEGELATVQSGEKKNGVLGYIDAEYCEEKNYVYSLKPCLTVARTGAAGNVTFQANGCCVGDSAKILELKENPKSIEIFLFLKTILMMNKYRYTYARKVTEENYSAETIMLPVISKHKPDYEYMENYIKSLNVDISSIPDYFMEEGYNKACWYMDNVDENQFEKQFAGRIETIKISLKDRQWEEFHLFDLFVIDSGNKLDKSKMTSFIPSINFVGRSSENNGVTAYVDEIEEIVPYTAGCLTIALGGEYLGSCFIQNYSFYTSQNVVVLKPIKEMNAYVKLFIAHLIRYESSNNYKAFARELNAHIKKDFLIKLPIDMCGNPDYSFMEEYIKARQFSSKIDG